LCKYLIENFNVKVFNIHSQSEYSFGVYNYSKSKYRENIFVENVYEPLNEKEIKKFGKCILFSYYNNIIKKLKL
jgi:hypothetical protein